MKREKLLLCISRWRSVTNIVIGWQTRYSIYVNDVCWPLLEHRCEVYTRWFATTSFDFNECRPCIIGQQVPYGFGKNSTYMSMKKGIVFNNFSNFISVSHDFWLIFLGFPGFHCQNHAKITGPCMYQERLTHFCWGWHVHTMPCVLWVHFNNFDIQMSQAGNS